MGHPRAVEVYDFCDRESWIAWVQREAGRSPDERRAEVAQRKWMEVRHLKGKVTRPSRMSHMVRAHSLSAVHGLATAAILAILQRLPPVALVGSFTRQTFARQTRQTLRASRSTVAVTV